MCNHNAHHHDRCLLPFLRDQYTNQAQDQFDRAPTTAASNLDNTRSPFLPTIEPALHPLPGPGVPRLEPRVPILQRRQLPPLPVLGLVRNWHGFAAPSSGTRPALGDEDGISPHTTVPVTLPLRPAPIHHRLGRDNHAPDLAYGPLEATGTFATQLTPTYRSIRQTDSDAQPIPSSAVLVFPPTPRANAWPPAMLTPFPLRVDPHHQDSALPSQNSLVYRGYSWSPHRGCSLCSDEAVAPLTSGGAVVGPSGLPTPPYVPPWYEGGGLAPWPDLRINHAGAVDLPGLRDLNFIVFNAGERPDEKPNKANGGANDGAAEGPSHVRRPVPAPRNLRPTAHRSNSPDWPAVPANTPEDRVDRHFWTAASRGDDVCYDVTLRKGQPPPTPAQETFEEEARERVGGATLGMKVKENWDDPSSGEDSPAGK
ncbi:hypothetical protein LTR37_015819 [Vermiconidia calcicola]|uniref:Uncharacterized protein n=1 Tax=Vermiconidia calcicola TaxID=1690605 RepID=A0ACC3MQE5_9PEZI|nr:hypothetical protein LTR37_015819 [Vermiconidia calcicola]